MYFLWKYFSEELKTSLIIASLLCWALISSYMVFTQKSETLLIQMNGFDTRVIEESQRPLVEVENFFHNFVGLFYSYNSKNFETRMNRVVPMIEIEVMRQYQQKINSMYDKLQKDHTDQFSYIEKITRINDLDYELKIRVERRTRGQDYTSDYILRATVKRTKRTKENPYGLQVDRLEEVRG